VKTARKIYNIKFLKSKIFISIHSFIHSFVRSYFHSSSSRGHKDSHLEKWAYAGPHDSYKKFWPCSTCTTKVKLILFIYRRFSNHLDQQHLKEGYFANGAVTVWWRWRYWAGGFRYPQFSAPLNNPYINTQPKTW